MSLCTECNSKPINNKHFKLCWLCNKKRLDESKSKSPKPSSGTKSARTGTRSSSTKNIRTVEKNLQKSSFRAQILSERPEVCTGCHDGTHLTLSHTIPVSLRKDLEFNSLNVELECMACHTKWEHGDLTTQKTLLNYHKKVNWIRFIDPEYYERRFKE